MSDDNQDPERWAIPILAFLVILIIFIWAKAFYALGSR